MKYQNLFLPMYLSIYLSASLFNYAYIYQLTQVDIKGILISDFLVFT